MIRLEIMTSQGEKHNLFVEYSSLGKVWRLRA